MGKAPARSRAAPGLLFFGWRRKTVTWEASACLAIQDHGDSDQGSIGRRAARILPGLVLCGLIATAGYALAEVELALFGRAWIEALVLAILIGAIVRTIWLPGSRWKSGIDFSAKLVLEIAVVLLGASVSAATIMSAGWPLLISILAIVAGAITLSFVVGRMLGLSKRLAMLVACGNSICGNSAIAAVAPVIGADGDDVASSIAFTAVLGVLVVLLLPLIGAILQMTEVAYGALAGLTVYAVPQVIAAAAPIGPKAVQIGTLVKLIRVLMLGPVCLVLSLCAAKMREETDEPAPHVTAGDRPRPGRPALHQLVPWFIIGFLVMVDDALGRPRSSAGPCTDWQRRDDSHGHFDGSIGTGRRFPHRLQGRRPRHCNCHLVAAGARIGQLRFDPSSRPLAGSARPLRVVRGELDLRPARAKEEDQCRGEAREGQPLHRSKQTDAVGKPAREDRPRGEPERVVREGEDGEGGPVQCGRSQVGDHRTRRSSRSGSEEHAKAQENELRRAGSDSHCDRDHESAAETVGYRQQSTLARCTGEPVADRSANDHPCAANREEQRSERRCLFKRQAVIADEIGRQPCGQCRSRQQGEPAADISTFQLAAGEKRANATERHLPSFRWLAVIQARFPHKKRIDESE